MTSSFEIAIDKLTITSNDIGADQAESIVNQMTDLAIKDITNPYQIKNGRWRRIESSIPTPLDRPLSTDRIRVEVGKKHTGHPDFRFEFNPAKVGSSGMDDLCDFLTSFGVDAHRIISGGIVTRIDFALDLLDLSANNVILRSKGQQKHGVYSDRNGVPQSLMLGSTRSNRLVGYNKSKKTTDREIFRVERRIKKRIEVNRLDLLSNPFSNIELVSTESVRPHLDPFYADNIFDSMRIRGVSHVIRTLPAATRTAINRVMKDPNSTLLPSIEEVWQQYPQLLKDTGLDRFLLPIVPPNISLVPDDQDQKLDASVINATE